jgi:hypothetical protein
VGGVAVIDDPRRFSAVPQDFNPEIFEVIDSDAYSVRFLLAPSAVAPIPIIGIAFHLSWPGEKALVRAFSLDDTRELISRLTAAVAAADRYGGGGALCIFCARFVGRLAARLGGPTQNPLPAEAPQVPENTPAAEPPANPTQNDPIASAAAGTPDHCGPRAWILGRKCCPDCKHAEGPDRTISRCFGCGYPGDTDEIEVPTFNHTRGDSPLNPCPICAKAMGAELGRTIGRAAVAAAAALDHDCQSTIPVAAGGARLETLRCELPADHDGRHRSRDVSVTWIEGGGPWQFDLEIPS